MAKAQNLKGRKFGRLTVVERVASPNGRRTWLCLCECGKETHAPTGHLNAGMRVSCGCQMPDSKRTHGKSHSAEYRAWENARARCQNPATKRYPLYGGRGIRMCQEWSESFEAFYRDMGDRPSTAHSLDRIDSNGHYEPGNCRWATIVEQNNNRSFNRHVVLNGVRMTVAQAADITGIHHSTILHRLERGLSDSEAVFHG